MRNTIIDKDRRRDEEYEQKNNKKLIWKLSLKYSSILIKNIDNHKLSNNCYVVYDQFMNEIKSLDIDIRNKNIHKIWNTMINSLKNDRNIKMAVKQLHLTNIYHN
jgi:hypothetical protein